MVTREKMIDNRFVVQLFESEAVTRKFDFFVLVREIGSGFAVPCETDSESIANRFFFDTIFVLSRLKNVSLKDLHKLS